MFWDFEIYPFCACINKTLRTIEWRCQNGDYAQAVVYLRQGLVHRPVVEMTSIFEAAAAVDVVRSHAG